MFKVHLTKVESDVKILQFSFQILKEHAKNLEFFQGKEPNLVKKLQKT